MISMQLGHTVYEEGLILGTDNFPLMFKATFKAISMLEFLVSAA
jgi:hypothetical protein